MGTLQYLKMLSRKYDAGYKNIMSGPVGAKYRLFLENGDMKEIAGELPILELTHEPNS